MKTALLCIMLMLSGTLSAQTIENPSFKARSGSTDNITRIERTPESTRVYIHAIFRPHWWIKVDGNNYLEDAATGKKYQFKSVEGIEFNKEVYMPASGEKDFVLVFEPLPKETQVIHLLDSTYSEGNTFDISLVPQKKKNTSPLANVRGNWFKTDATSAWEYGVYDSITFMNNRIYTNENIRKKGKRVVMTVRDKQNGTSSTLVLTPQKDGNCKIQINGADESLYTKRRGDIQTIAPDAGFQQFFRRDTACLQGYIDGYDPRLGFDTGLIYLSNEIIGDDYPTVAQIDKDGSFTCKFVINHPVEQSLTLGNAWIPFFIEPGQTLTMYIDWEELMARTRARDHRFPIRNTTYMGPSAPISYLSKDLGDLITYDYSDLSKSQKELTPNQFKERMKPFIAQWNHIADSLTQRYKPSEKAVRLIKNKADLQAGTVLFDFTSSRRYYAEQDTANLVLKVKEEDSYYDFLKEMPLDDVTILANNRTGMFINRFEYMEPFQKAYSHKSKPIDIINMTIYYPKKMLLSFLKEKGVKLNKEQEALRLRDEKLAGKSIGVSASTENSKHKEDYEKLKYLYEKEQALIKEYNQTYPTTVFRSEPDMDRSYASMNKEQNLLRDSIVAQLCNVPNPVAWQIAKVRSLGFTLKNIKTTEIAREYADNIKKELSIPYLIEATEQVYKATHPENKLKSYQLPEGKPTDIFRNIIKAHLGKVLFVDFWATTCGPCRGGIENTANLREKYKNHPEFQFIYITSQKDSPEKDYKQYVEKNLKGEASYYVTEAEFNYLRQLFQFNGIPHYELVEKDGSISLEDLSSRSIGDYLKKRFESTKQEEKPE